MMGIKIRYRPLSKSDYNMLGNLSAVAFLGLGLAARILMVQRLTLLILIFMPLSLLFYARAYKGSWDFIEKDDDQTTNVRG